MDPAALVGDAATRLIAGDYDRFVDCFADDVVIYGERQVSDVPVARNRSQLEAILERVRVTTPQLSVQVGEVAEMRAGVLAETIILTDDVWRLALAVGVSEDR